MWLDLIELRFVLGFDNVQVIIGAVVEVLQFFKMISIRKSVIRCLRFYLDLLVEYFCRARIFDSKRHCHILGSRGSSSTQLIPDSPRTPVLDTRVLGNTRIFTIWTTSVKGSMFIFNSTKVKVPTLIIVYRCLCYAFNSLFFC